MKRKYVAWLGYLCVMVFAGCQNTGDESVSSSTGSGIERVERAFEQAKTVQTTSDELLFGSLTDAALVGDRVFVLDESQNHVFSASVDLAHFDSLATHGRGPGEYERPVSMSEYDDSLWLFDARLNRITVFSETPEGEWRHALTGSPELRIMDFCRTPAGDVWAAGIKGDAFIHRLDAAMEKIVQSIPAPFDLNDLVMSEKARNTKITCHENFLFTVAPFENIMRVYDVKSGQFIQEIQIPGVFLTDVFLVDRGGQQAISYRFATGEAHPEFGTFNDALRNVMMIDGQVFLQYERNYREGPADQSFYISFLVNPTDYSVSRSETLPSIYAWKTGKFLVIGNKPEPFVQIRSE